MTKSHPVSAGFIRIMYVSSQLESFSFWLPGMVLIFVNITHGLPDQFVRPAFTSVAEMPLFFGTAIFAFEGISLVSGLWGLIFHSGVWSVLIFHSGVWSVLIFHSGVWSVLIFHSGVWSVLIFHSGVWSVLISLVSNQCWSLLCPISADLSSVQSVLIFQWWLIGRLTNWLCAWWIDWLMELLLNVNYWLTDRLTD